MKHGRTFHVLRKHGFKNVEKIFPFSTMATPFETEDTILTQEQADHINERHVYITEHPRERQNFCWHLTYCQLWPIYRSEPGKKKMKMFNC